MHLHVVSFNVPFPADYGGVIDVFHRVRCLAQQGVKVHLHCYTYGRSESPELQRICEEVCYYDREMLPHHLLAKRPFIVASRCNKDLLARLRQDDYPILLEGLHNCWLLEQLRNDSRRTILVRAHNVEHDYYANLSKVENRWWKRVYLRQDARKMRRYEPVLLKADTVLAITEADAAHFREIGCNNVILHPAMHPFDDVIAPEGVGDYAFYHGNLSVPENAHAAEWLITKVFAETPYTLKVAGYKPSTQLKQLAKQYDNVQLIDSPDENQMQQLMQSAQVNILVTDQPTGLKLKLLHSLYCGRHCLVNDNMLAGTPLHLICHIANTPQEMQQQLSELMQRPFTQDDRQSRSQLLSTCYSNVSNIRHLIDVIGSDK